MYLVTVVNHTWQTKKETSLLVTASYFQFYIDESNVTRTLEDTLVFLIDREMDPREKNEVRVQYITFRNTVTY